MDDHQGPTLLSRLKVMTRLCRSRAEQVGALHGWWDDIFESEKLIREIETKEQER